MARLRTRKHKVVLARSAGGDAGITFVLVILGAFMFLPMLYVLMQSLKPLDELWMYPPRFYVMSPTLDNFIDLFNLMNGATTLKFPQTEAQSQFREVTQQQRTIGLYMAR